MPLIWADFPWHRLESLTFILRLTGRNRNSRENNVACPKRGAAPRTKLRSRAPRVGVRRRFDCVRESYFAFVSEISLEDSFSWNNWTTSLPGTVIKVKTSSKSIGVPPEHKRCVETATEGPHLHEICEENFENGRWSKDDGQAEAALSERDWAAAAVLEQHREEHLDRTLGLQPARSLQRYNDFHFSCVCISLTVVPLRTFDQALGNRTTMPPRCGRRATYQPAAGSTTSRSR